jgi:EAL domain-containing protein (putative c-di-GMP-specific phosphodiesterase class I)
VETIEQMEFLRSENCAQVQGYHIGRPAPVEHHAAMMLSGETAAAVAAYGPPDPGKRSAA